MSDFIKYQHFITECLWLILKEKKNPTINFRSFTIWSLQTSKGTEIRIILKWNAHCLKLVGFMLEYIKCCISLFWYTTFYFKKGYVEYYYYLLYSFGTLWICLMSSTTFILLPLFSSFFFSTPLSFFILRFVAWRFNNSLPASHIDLISNEDTS